MIDLLVRNSARIYRVTTFSAKAAVESNEPGSVMGICQATLMLSDLASQLSESHHQHLSVVEPISQRVQAQQTAVRQLVFKQLQNVCSHEFAAAEFDRLATLHVLDVHSGAELPERIRDTFLHLVAASDQYNPGERAPSLLQTMLAEERNAAQAGKAKSGNGITSGAAVASPNDSLTVLYRAVPAVKFRGMVERVMQTQFVWLQTFHAMQIHVQSELQEARTVLSAVESGAALEVDWSSGLPHVHVARKSGDSSVADPSGLGVPAPVRDESGNAEPQSDPVNIQGDSSSQKAPSENIIEENETTAQPSMSKEGDEGSSEGAAPVEQVTNGKASQNGSTNGASHAELATAGASPSLLPVRVVGAADKLVQAASTDPLVHYVSRVAEENHAVVASTDVGEFAGPSQSGSAEAADRSGSGSRVEQEAGKGLQRGSPHAADRSREDHGQVIGSLAGNAISLEEFVKQRERILHGVRSLCVLCQALIIENCQYHIEHMRRQWLPGECVACNQRVSLELHACRDEYVTS